MTKSIKRNVIVSSLLAICLCVSLIAGATFAIFTSESKVNIAVTSGKVKVTATISDFAAYSPKLISAEEGNAILDDTNMAVDAADENEKIFGNGGTAKLSYAEDGTAIIELRSITPGDSVTFKITVTNHSNVKAKYRTLVAKADGSDDVLYGALVFNVGGMTVDGKSAWNELAPVTDDNGAEVAAYECGVELPAKVSGEEYMGKTCSIVFAVEAVQGNVDTTETVVVGQDALNNDLTLADLKDENGNISPVEVTLGDAETTDIAYSEHSSGYTGKGVMLGSTNLNKYGATPAAVGEYKFTFKDGTITSAATGYSSIDGYKDTSVYMLVPANSDVVFENMTFNGVVSFDIQKYTSPWSNLNSITFKNCVFNGIIIGTCPASNVTFDGCVFNAYTNTASANNSNPIWWREDTEGSDANANPIKTFTFVNNKVTSTRPVKIERVGKTVSPIFTIKNNTFDISAQADDTVTKNMAVNIGMGEKPNLPFTLIDDGNIISANTAALYTAALASGSNQYKEMSGMKVTDADGNDKVITAMVWKTTTGETFELKTVD